MEFLAGMLLTLTMVIWLDGSNSGWPSSDRRFNEGHKYKIIPNESFFLCAYADCALFWPTNRMLPSWLDSKTTLPYFKSLQQK